MNFLRFITSRIHHGLSSTVTLFLRPTSSFSRTTTSCLSDGAQSACASLLRCLFAGALLSQFLLGCAAEVGGESADKGARLALQRFDCEGVDISEMSRITEFQKFVANTGGLASRICDFIPEGVGGLSCTKGLMWAAAQFAKTNANTELSGRFLEHYLSPSPEYVNGSTEEVPQDVALSSHNLQYPLEQLEAADPRLQDVEAAFISDSSHRLAKSLLEEVDPSTIIDFRKSRPGGYIPDGSPEASKYGLAMLHANIEMFSRPVLDANSSGAITGGEATFTVWDIIDYVQGDRSEVASSRAYVTRFIDSSNRCFELAVPTRRLVEMEKRRMAQKFRVEFIKNIRFGVDVW